MNQVKSIHDDYNEIPFEWMSEKYGRAEFVLCPIYNNNGLITKMHMQPIQQESESNNVYVFENEQGWNGIMFGLIVIENKIEFPDIWTTFYCKIHNTQCIRFYVPKKITLIFYYKQPWCI